MDLPSTDLGDTIASAPHLGREALLSGDHTADLHALLLRRGVLVWRDLDITPAQQRTITAQFGPIRADADEDGLQRVTIDPDQSAEYTAYQANTMLWHMDGYHDQTTPCFGGSFRPIVLAPRGGETEFLNAYAAYDALAPHYRAAIDHLRVVYSAVTVGLAANPDASDAQVEAWRRRPRPVQPLVWQHADGRKSLMLGAAVSHVVGMEPADSYDLLCALRAHMNEPRFTYRHAWRLGDLLVWNNTGTLHRARPFDPASGRLLHRYTIDGSEAITPCG